MAELADAADSKSADRRSWGFDSPSRHQQNKELKIELASQNWRGQNCLVAVLVAVGLHAGMPQTTNYDKALLGLAEYISVSSH